MNKAPVSYLQTDSRWKNVDYSAPGEKTTIGASGCGPTAMAMVLATWADPSVTPKTEAAWALTHGYKAPHQGTYYGYFAKAAKRYRLTCTMLNGASIYGNANSPYHAQAKAALDRGDYVIACMGKGLWTSSGHYVVPWKIEGNTIYINDPASTKAARTRGDYARFKREVKLYWIIKNPKKEDPDMTEKQVQEIIEKTVPGMIRDAVKATITGLNIATAAEPEPDWSQKEGHWQRATEAGIVDGTRPRSSMTRAEVVAVLGRLGLVHPSQE